MVSNKFSSNRKTAIKSEQTIKQRRRYSRLSTTPICLLALIFLASVYVRAMDLFHVKFIENNDSRLIATSNFNYAISSPKLSTKNWRAISVNGDEVIALELSPPAKLVSNKAQLGPEQMAFIEQLREEIANSGHSGYTHVSTAAGGNGFTISSSEERSSSSSFSSSSSSSSSSSGGAMKGGEMSMSSQDDENFSVSKSNLPFNWSRVFFNKDLITFVSRSGEVRTLSVPVLSPEEATSVDELREEALKMRGQQSAQFANTMQNSMDMVSNVFNNIMGQFPRPPDYRSSVGNMFGDNFPFGPNNSPFSQAAGWPFAGDGNSGAFAFAGGR